MKIFIVLNFPKLRYFILHVYDKVHCTCVSITISMLEMNDYNTGYITN